MHFAAADIRSGAEGTAFTGQYQGNCIPGFGFIQRLLQFVEQARVERIQLFAQRDPERGLGLGRVGEGGSTVAVVGNLSKWLVESAERTLEQRRMLVG